MATIVAQANGQYHAGATWTGGVVPGAADTARTGNFTVTISSADVTADMLEATGSGQFVVDTAGRTITANIRASGTNTNGALQCTHAAGVVTISGAITQNSSATNAHTVNVTGTGDVVINGNVTGGTGSGYAVRHNSTGTVAITGNVMGGSGSNSVCVFNNSTGTVAITGNATGGSGSNSYGALNMNTGTVAITGNATGGSTNTARGAHNQGTGTLTVGGICYGGTELRAFGLYGANAGGVTTFKRAVFGDGVSSPVGGYVRLQVDATVNYAEFPRHDTGAAHRMSNDYPVEADVKTGVVYQLGTRTGTLVGGAVGISPIRGNVG